MKTGWYKQLSSEYFAEPAIDYSLIKQALISPKNILSKFTPTEATLFGSGFHLLVLEPDIFPKWVRQRNGGVGTDKFKKQVELDKAELGKEADNIIYLSEKDIALIKTLAKELKKCREAMSLIEGCEYEMSGYYAFPNGKAPGLFKIKPDCMKASKGNMLDIKTVSSSNFEEFGKMIANYRYDVQAGFYLWTGNKIQFNSELRGMFTDFYWIIVEKSEPYKIAIYQATPDLLHIGKNEAVRGINIIRDAYNNEHFDKVIQDYVDMPGWYLNKYKELLK